MRTLAELRSRYDEIGTTLRSILDGAENGVLTEEQETKYEALRAERAGVLKSIERKHELEAEERANKGTAEKVEPGDAAAPKDEKRGDARVTGDREADRPFDSLGEQLRAVANAEMRGGEIDKRLLRIQHEERTQTGAVAGDGGFLVDQPLADGILKRAINEGPLWSRVRRYPLAANSNGIRLNKIKTDDLDHGTAYGGVQAYWTAESAAISASDLEFEQSELRLKKIAALVYATDELLADAGALESEMNSEVPAALRYKVEDAIINGTGAGRPLGIRSVAANIEVAKDTSQTADTVTSGNVANMFGRMIPGSRGNAIWLMDHTVYPQIITMTLGDQPVWTPNFQESPNGTLLGRPIFISEHLPVVGDADDIMLIDPKQYGFIEKGMQSAASMHVRFIYDEMAFRFTYRCDGQPLFKNALTTRNDSTLSPFVSVAARA